MASAGRQKSAGLLAVAVWSVEGYQSSPSLLSASTAYEKVRLSVMPAARKLVGSCTSPMLSVPPSLVGATPPTGALGELCAVPLPPLQATRVSAATPAKATRRRLIRGRILQGGARVAHHASGGL